MEELKDKSLHLTAEKLAEELQKMDIYNEFYEDLQMLAASQDVSIDDFKKTLVQAVNIGSMETNLRNAVFHWLRSHGNNKQIVVRDEITSRESLDYLRKAQITWERRIQKSLESMCEEIGINLSCLRSSADRDEMLQKWNELSTYNTSLERLRPVYAPKDFLEVLFSLHNPNYRMISDDMIWDFTYLPLKVKTLPELRHHYRDLATADLLLGLTCCQCLTTLSSGSTSQGELERISLGEKVLQHQHAPVCQEFLKLGAPRSLRGRLWAQILGSNVKTSEQHYSELKQRVLHYDMLIDKLITKDVQLTACNDDQYFVFEDVLHQIMLCFTRDTDVLSVFNNSTSHPILTSLKGKPPMEAIYPPNGIIPFHGFTMYAAPVCYLFNDPVPLYYTFRAFYLRYWFRLHVISSHPQSILGLCILFQRLLQRHETKIWSHFMSHNIHPIRVVFKWLMKGFSGHLLPEQLLNLWDMVIAYDSLEVLPLLAVAILSFRKDNLLQVNTLQNVDSVLVDLSSLNVMSLLQLALKGPIKMCSKNQKLVYCPFSAAPVCYLFNDPVPLYYTFRAFYLRYWFRLHVISSHPQSILGLCILFQRLLQRHETKIWSHFMSHNIHPIRVVFKWLMKGFSGHLLPEQLLNLWDMVIAYDSLEVLPLLAVAILSFRKDNLLQVNTLQNVDSVLVDLSSLNVMSLLQLALKGPIKM